LPGTALDTFVPVQKIVVGKYLGSLAFGAYVLCSSSMDAAPSAPRPDDAPAAVAVQQARVAPVSGLRDEVAMVLVGSALIGLAAAVRRAA
jgi:hypothetical protein